MNTEYDWAAWGNTEDMNAQIFKTGVHSADNKVKQDALLRRAVDGALSGRTSDLNECYRAKKEGRLSELEYAEIRKAYDNY